MGRRKTNNSNPLVPVSSDEPKTELTRHQKLVRLLAEGLSVPEAGVMAGFTEAYSNSGLYATVRTPRMQSKIREFCLQNNLLQVPKVLRLYDRALKQVGKEVENGSLENLSKVKHITKQTLQMGGLLHEDAPVQNISFVDVKALQLIIQRNLGMPTDEEETEEQ